MANTSAKTAYSDGFIHTSTKGDISGIRLGGWKLLIDNPHLGYSSKVSKKKFEGVELYKLSNDVSESKNLASSNPEKVSELKKALEELTSKLVK